VSGILVCLGDCKKKMPFTRWYISKETYLIVLEAGKSKIEAPEDLVSGVGLFTRFIMASSLCVFKR
jgi:hypothetical protein